MADKWKEYKERELANCRRGVIGITDDNGNYVVRNRDEFIAYWLERGSWDPALGRNENAEELGRDFDRFLAGRLRAASNVVEPRKRTRGQKWDAFSQAVMTAGAFSSNPTIARDNILALGLRAQTQVNHAAQAQALENLHKQALAPVQAAQAAEAARAEQDARDARLAAMIAKATADEFEKRGLNPPAGS